MSLIYSCTFSGLQCDTVEVQAHISRGLPSFHLVGLGDTAVQEAKERVRSSIKNSGAEFPLQRKVVNLAPAQIRKHGTQFDLPIALSLLMAHDSYDHQALSETLVVGELALNGQLKAIKGTLAIVQHAKDHGFKQVVIPKANSAEASFLKGIDIYAFNHLSEVLAFISNKTQFLPLKNQSIKKPSKTQSPLNQIHGLEFAKRALSIAAAGRHHLLLSGVPGAGKTTLARALPSLLPPMSDQEIITTTKIYSVAGLLKSDKYLITERPFRSVHHTASTSSIIGGGNKNPRPGEITLAHNGVLFFDEINEFSHHALESLRQPLEDKKIHITRAHFTSTFPSSFLLIATSNPCPCGYYQSTIKSCHCSLNTIQRYQNKLSGPILDRIDLFINIDQQNNQNLLKTKPLNTEKQSHYQQKVLQAYQIQKKRYHQFPEINYNADLSLKEIKKFCPLDTESLKYLNLAANNLQLSTRTYLKLIKIARTIADLDQDNKITKKHVAEALQYRQPLKD